MRVATSKLGGSPPIHCMEHEITEAAIDILSVFCHPSEQRYDELLEAIKSRLRRLVELKGIEPSTSGLQSPRSPN